MNREGKNKSFWETKIKTTSIPDENTLYDAIIIGAGITGITLANELQRMGKKCLIIEKEHPGFGTTGRTTAFVNNFFDTSYDDIINNFGEESAKILAESAKETLFYIKQNILNSGTDCDFEECSFYLFSSEKDQNQKLCKILKAHQIVDIKTNRTYEVPFDLPYKKALEIKGQIQFHPLKYIKILLNEFEKNGGKILNQTLVTKIGTEKNRKFAETEKGEIFFSKNIVWATHSVPGNTRFNLLLAPYRSYALASKLLEKPEKIAQTADLEEPYHYIRHHKSGSEYFLIAGGFDHKTGHEKDTETRFQELENYVKERCECGEIVNKWSGQYYVPADGLPYIGKMPGEENIYICTGYNGNGMTFGPMASLIIPKLMDGEKTELTELLSPSRINIKSSARNAVSENADVFFRFFKDKLFPETEDHIKNIKKDEGKIIELEGKTVAVYKDLSGKMHFLNPKCTHLGCNVQWNTSEKSWDCPCHGSRFEGSGKILTGPALKNLEKSIQNYNKMENITTSEIRGTAVTIPGETTTISHNLGTTDIVVALYNVATGNELNSGITIIDENTVKITTASGAPEKIRVVIMGI